MTETFPLSSEQRSMLHMDRLLGPGILHNLVASLEVPRGTTNRTVRHAVERLAERNPALTATLAEGAHGTRQQTGRRDVEVHSFAPSSGGDIESRLDRLRHLRLDRSTGARATVRRHTDGAGDRLILAVDHLVCDAAARELVVRDTSSLLTGGGPAADAHTAPQAYAAYCREQEAALADGQVRRREIERWKCALRGCRPLTGLGSKAAADAPREARCWEIHEPGPALHDALRHLAAATATSPFVVGAALYATALWARTGVRSSALVTPVSTRRAPEHQRLVTNLVNERPVPYRIVPDEGFTVLAQRLGGSFLSALRGASLAIPDLVATVDGYRELLHAPDCAYVQLQVSLGSAAPSDLPAGERSWPWGAPYAAPTGITCTVFRVNASPRGARLSTFHGGPTGQGTAVAAISKDVIRLAGLAAGDPRTPVGRLADEAC
ncbi:condensation domain-containing protein [Streptomyces sp. NBC_00448]|uniref:condensation domain-containing protein n=1 Tax=Streptomyces sp. NBC_00448 TaxID=2903652 RepID=UPI002E2387A3